MKRIVISMAALILVIGISTAMAAKPLNVIPLSNGFPSGPHFNLNIHGQNPATGTCEDVVGGNSIFIAENPVEIDPVTGEPVIDPVTGEPVQIEETIQYVTNRFSPVTELTVLDPCGQCMDNDGDPGSCVGDPAKVQLPYERDGYLVFTRLRGKPNSSIKLYPNDIIELCKLDPTIEGVPDYIDCSLVLGLITAQGTAMDAVAADDGMIELRRFDLSADKTQGKGYAAGKDITQLFLWSGWVIDASLDLNGDDVIAVNDVLPEDLAFYDVLTVNGIIDPDEFQLWLNAQATLGLATYYENEWILNVADLVVSEQNVDNNNAKLLQIRFYPKATTTYIEDCSDRIDNDGDGLIDCADSDCPPCPAPLLFQ